MIKSNGKVKAFRTCVECKRVMGSQATVMGIDLDSGAPVFYCGNCAHKLGLDVESSVYEEKKRLEDLLQ